MLPYGKCFLSFIFFFVSIPRPHAWLASPVPAQARGRAGAGGGHSPGDEAAALGKKQKYEGKVNTFLEVEKNISTFGNPIGCCCCWGCGSDHWSVELSWWWCCICEIGRRVCNIRFNVIMCIFIKKEYSKSPVPASLALSRVCCPAGALRGGRPGPGES